MTVRRGYVQYVQLVHEAFGCFGSGDWERLRPLVADDNVMTPPEIWPDPGPSIGPYASIGEYQRLFEGDQQAVPTELQFTGVHRFAGDQFAESHYRLDRDAALAAAGL